MNRNILGIDVRHDAVSAVLIKSGIKGTSIEAHMYVPISIRDQDEDGLVASLETISKKMDISGCICVASFPADEISYRNVQVPFKGRKKIKKILNYELEPTIPFPIDDLVIDFVPIERDDQTNNNYLIAAAVEKSKLKFYLDTLTQMNISPKTVTVGGYSIALCLADRLDNHKNWIFVDLGSDKGTLFMISSGGIYLIRSFPVRSTARSHKIKSLCNTIRHTCFALERNLRLDFQTEGVWISGCGLDDLGFEQDVEQDLGLPVKRADLLQDMDVMKHQPKPESWIPFLMDNALSLALMEVNGIGGLNFRTGPFAAKKIWKENKKRLIQSGVLFIVVLALAFFNVFLDSYFMGKRMDRIDNQITEIFSSTFPDVKRIVDPVQQMRIKLQEIRKKLLLPGETEKHIQVIDILNNISKRIPQKTDVTFTRLVIGSGNVIISGDTDTFNSVDNIKSDLEPVDFFKKIVISSANISKSDNRVRFKLKISL